MKRYEYPDRVTRVTGGTAVALAGFVILSLSFCELAAGSPEFIVMGPISFFLSLICIVTGVNFVLRPPVYVHHDGDEIVYGRAIGRGRILLSDIQSIRTGIWGMLTVMRTQRGKVRWYYIMACNWDLLESVVRGARNATADVPTMELLDPDSPRRKRADKLVKRITRFGKIYLYCVVVGMSIWLLALSVIR
jgi:hypothetical protein